MCQDPPRPVEGEGETRGSQESPKTPKKHPKTAKDRPKRLQEAPKRVPGSPKSTLRGFKISKRASENAAETKKEAHQASINQNNTLMEIE